MREIRPGVWKLTAYAGFVDGQSKQRHRTFRGNRTEARKARDAFQRELDDRRTPAVQAGTVGELLEEFWTKHAWKTVGARRKAREDLDTYLLPALGHLKVSRFDEKPIEALYAGLQASGDQCKTASGRPMADTTLRRLHATLRSALNRAVKRNRLGWNPALVVEVPSEPAPDIRVPDPEEVLLMCAETVGEFGVFVRAAVATGRRRQDLLALRLNDLKSHEPALVFDERVTLQETDDPLCSPRRSARSWPYWPRPAAVSAPLRDGLSSI